ncbi:HD-GYP domain-containing protein [Wukongibacter sp. M2B1]|uniref:HD-GYP domain-containing protein n=1 Tax=Wukongibacter sp. M2B1 TaxID=3088895 RepID=UPI003D7BBAA2
MNNFNERIKMKVNNFILGKVVAESIHNELGALVIGLGSTLDKRVIRKLIQLGYTEIWVFEDKNSEISNEKSTQLQTELPQDIDFDYEEPLKIYETIKDSIESIIEGIEDKKQVSFKKIYGISDMLIDKFTNNREILQMIKYFKDIDKTIYSHYIVVGFLCLMMGKWMDFSRIKIRNLICAGLLHDIKEIKLTNNGICEKLRDPNEYTKFVYESMQKIFGMNLDIALGVLQHNEREDGSGYPMGMRGEQIHDFAKIIGIADTYDNLISHYVYNNKQSAFKVLEIFFNNSFGLFNPKFLRVFLKNISYYHLGDIVTLNTGKQAEIIFINPNYISRPIVKMDNVYVDLFKNKELDII